MPISRRNLVRAGTAAIVGSTFILKNPVSRLTARRFRVPLIDGERELVMVAHGSLLNEAHAQMGGYYYAHPNAATQYQQYYASMMAQQQWAQMQWMQYQQALAQYQQRIQAAQQQYTWMNQQRAQGLEQAIGQYKSGWEVGNPSFMDAIQSVYGYARRARQNPLGAIGEVVMYGLNALGKKVKIKDLLPAAGAAWNALDTWLGASETESQASLMPQSDEDSVQILMPDDSLLPGRGYKTKEKGFAVSANPFIDPQTGKQGHLAKLFHEGDAKYLII